MMSLFKSSLLFSLCAGELLWELSSCPRSAHGTSIDPEPNWSLLSEIESVEKNLNPFLKFPQPFSKTALRMGRSGGGFVMRVSDVEMESDEEEEEVCSQICTMGETVGM
ncbi:hypothetical protein Bca101_065834 [Brassica carinata]